MDDRTICLPWDKNFGLGQTIWAVQYCCNLHCYSAAMHLAKCQKTCVYHCPITIYHYPFYAVATSQKSIFMAASTLHWVLLHTYIPRSPYCMLCHWATTTKQPPALTTLYICTYWVAARCATEAFQSHLCSTYRGLWGLVVVQLL